MLMVASGLAFHGVLAVLPIVASIGAVWTVLGGQGLLDAALHPLGEVLPGDAFELARNFLTNVPDRYGLGAGLAVNLLIVLWTSWRSSNGLITALNIMFDEREERPRIRRGVIAFLIAAGGILFLIFALIVLALPVLVPQAAAAVGVARWPVLAAVFCLGLMVLFRYAPSRTAPLWTPLFAGALTSTLLWIGGSVALTVYIGTVGSFDTLYGSISSVVVTLIWFFASALTVLTGAEIDAILQERAGGRRRSRGLRQELRKRE